MYAMCFGVYADMGEVFVIYSNSKVLLEAKKTMQLL